MDGELANLLMQSPLYQKLEDIKNIMQGLEPKEKQKDNEPYIDERDDTLFTSDEQLVPIDLDAVNAREFVVYKFANFVRDLLVVHCFHKPVDILLADKLPPNPHLGQNAYRNSFHYDSNNRILYLRRDRLENAGEFILVLVHTLSHIQVEDMRSDSDPNFVKEFYKALSVVCSDLFLARYKRSSALNQAMMTAPDETKGIVDASKRMLENLFGDAHNEIDRENVVDDLLDTKLVRNKKNESEDFNQDAMFQRLGRYTDFIVSNKLRTFLGDVESKLSDAKALGSENEVDKRLKELDFKVRTDLCLRLFE